MKFLIKLFILFVYPSFLFAAFNPVLKYNLDLLNISSVMIKEAETKFTNWNSNGCFSLGIELDDIFAIFVSPNFVLEKQFFLGNEKEYNKFSINTEFDFYLNRSETFKPFISANISYLNINVLKSHLSKIIFGLGIGFKYFLDNNIFIGTNLNYNKSINANVEGIDYLLSLYGLNLGIISGYKF